MKRHPSLQDLSGDHHQGLVQARRLVKAAAGEETKLGMQEVARGFVRFFWEHANHHFREEEEVLLPAFARHADPFADPIPKMLVEHIQIRRLVADLEQQLSDGAPLPRTMSEVGTLLRAHIRLEEDVIFPLIERAMPEDALTALAEALKSDE
jgi:hemerythrin-like domain-containing protein